MANCFIRFFAVFLGFVLARTAAAVYDEWAHHGSIYLNTTREGAALPKGAVVERFPVLVRLHRDFFDFRQAQPQGEDVRFASPAGEPLPYQIEEWDAEKGEAIVWVRVPVIRGDATQEIRASWGKAGAASESNAKAVFNEDNGFLSVWHMGETLEDEAGTLPAARNAGTEVVPGLIGRARRFAAGQGIFCGDTGDRYPTGANAHSSEAWVRAEKSNGRVLGWGNERARGKVVMGIASPPRVRMDCYFSGADAWSEGRFPMGEWAHVMHTYRAGDSRIYINGELRGISTNARGPLAIQAPARMWLGGWHDHYDFAGDMDEVRISREARSEDWVRLQYENQKEFQTLTGPLTTPGAADVFSVSPARITVAEGGKAAIQIKADGARKIFWRWVEGGSARVVAVDRLQYQVAGGRVRGDKEAAVRVSGVFAEGVRTLDVPVLTREALAEPEVSLRVERKSWDGRRPLEVTAEVHNQSELELKGAGIQREVWEVSGPAVLKRSERGKLVLLRAQGSGLLRVTGMFSNGGHPSSSSVEITVTEPEGDPWVERKPDARENPADNQFYPRDDNNEGKLIYSGRFEAAGGQDVETVYLKVHAEGQPHYAATQRLGADRMYYFAAPLRPGLIRYSSEFGVMTRGRAAVLHSATNLVCGDAYLIQGQSNAVATDWGEEEVAYRSPWIRTFGGMGEDVERSAAWGEAVARDREGGRFQIGYWGLALGRRLLETHGMPVCFLNGAVGGTRVDQHQRTDTDPTALGTIYGRLLWRARAAKLAHGIRGVFWHQGENDQGADGPTGGYGWETYRQYFIDLAAAWKEDYPNIQRYYVFQIWPKACAMGIDGSDNRLREVQRRLPEVFSKMSVMSTLGIEPRGECHYPAAGYAAMAELIAPLVERDFYAKTRAGLGSGSFSLTPPNLLRAAYRDHRREEVVLEFDQPVRWEPDLARDFYLDGQGGRVMEGSVLDRQLSLKLNPGAPAKTITYLDGRSWDPRRLLRGENGIAALTFCEVTIAEP